MGADRVAAAVREVAVRMFGRWIEWNDGRFEKPEELINFVYVGAWLSILIEMSAQQRAKDGVLPID